MATLHLTFFGTYLAMLDRQPLTHFRAANNQGLLAYLALQPERPFPREHLAALFWPDEPESQARNNLRQALYQLRRLLGDLEQPERPFLNVTRQTVQFNSNSDTTLDVSDFQAAVEQGDLAAAAALYQGELLAGFTCDSLEFEDWLRQQREAYHQLALVVLGERTQEALAAGQLDAAQGLARRQLSLEPWRESAHRQLMRALALSGNRSGALQQFEACQDVLLAELGISPEAETRHLRDEIAAGRLEPTPFPTAQVATRPPSRQKLNLPTASTPLIGREPELAELIDLLNHRHERLVTLVAPGGMGKTRLALAAGEALVSAYPDGVTFVDLTPLREADGIPQALAAALDYQAPDLDQALWPQLLDWLSRQHLLLIFDNFEHLIEGTHWLSELLQRCPQVNLLVTSRQWLNLASENRYELGGLDLPENPSVAEARQANAVRLFVESGRRVASTFDIEADNAAAVVRICTLVEGMPLGLMLAATWLSLLAPEEIAAEIEAGLDILEADFADLPRRQRSLQAVFEGSWQSLTPAEKGALARLSVFRGGFTREAAATVAEANLRILLSLINKSLIHRDAANGRFTLHELLRQFAYTRLQQAGLEAKLTTAYCRYYAHLVQEEVHRSSYYYPGNVSARLEAEEDNIYWAWGLSHERQQFDALTQLAPGMTALQFAQGQHPQYMLQEVIQFMRTHGVAESDGRLLSLRLLETFVLFHYDKYLPRQNLDALVEELEAHGSPRLRYWAYNLQWQRPKLSQEEVRFWMEKHAAAAVEMGDEITLKIVEANLAGFELEFSLEAESAVETLRRLLAYFQVRLPGSGIVLNILRILSRYYRRKGEVQPAIQYGLGGLEIAKGWRNLYQIGHTCDNLARIYIEDGRPDLAARQQLDGFDWHLAIGQEWQTLGAIYTQVLNQPEFFGDLEMAVQLLAFVYHHPDAIPLYRQHIEHVLPRFEGELPPEVFATAWQAGGVMGFETAVEEVRQTLLRVGQPQAHSR